MEYMLIVAIHSLGYSSMEMKTERFATLQECQYVANYIVKERINYSTPECLKVKPLTVKGM